MGSAFVASIFALGLGGCSSTPNILGGGASAPQATLSPPMTPQPVSTQTAKIQIAPVIGSPDGVAKNLQTELASAMGRNGLTVATSTNATSEYVLRGYIVAARERTKAKISYIWDLTDRTGKRVHRVTGEEVVPGAGKDPWAALTPPVAQSIADKTARQIATWLPTSGSIVASNAGTGVKNPPPQGMPPATKTAYIPPQPSSPTTGSIGNSGPITAIVPTVTGAPGDGSTALTAAIQRELSKNGLHLANTPVGNAYKVEGKVAMGQSRGGKQPIRIDWNVIDPSGKKLGTVSQKNEVPQGSLDGSWGQTADAAAAAAAQGIIKLLPAKSIN
ncbi:hypothetical protein [Hyphomicrobium sp.]|uniref:hypothetical protein n=1 Tax=Hyphomicrobium sp. TaxID=82 RepID=UPI002C522910|nr:hypothetical protein [Hyphomicrobium sp.]HVZ03533.1 hypothetical protein [Hyphomicrobium sp.]